MHTDPNPGDITDWRVVKGVIEAVHALSPEARISIAEGGVWLPPERTDIIALLPDIEVADGFARAGYKQLLTDPDLAGVALDIVDLNFDDVAEVSPPGGGLVAQSYKLPKTVLESDVFIDVPVMKITGAVGMTVAMKNLIGIAPGMVYGWSKSRGFPPGSGNPGLWHSAPSLDETIVDLAGMADVDYVVVDAIVGMEKARITFDGGKAVRLNTVVAGADIVSVDAVCARLMGMNHDDMEFLTLSQRRGMGVAKLADIRLVGLPLERAIRRFEKYPADWGQNGEYGHYGQGNKTWLLKGPFAFGDLEAQALDPTQLPPPMAGEDGWSEPVYFYDDKIDLDRLFDDPVNSVTYAYAEIDAPRDQEAELWVGSDEGMRVWIDGELVYQFVGRRKHRLPNDRVPIRIRAGRSTCLVEATQKRGRYDFSLKICEPEEDPRYDGNTILGLAYSVPRKPTSQERELLVLASRERAQWYEDNTVDVTQPRRARLGAFFPEDAVAPWIALSAPVMWAVRMELEARLKEDGLKIFTDNIKGFRLKLVSPLINMPQPLALTVDDFELVPLRGDEGQLFDVTARLGPDRELQGWDVAPGSGEGSGAGTILGAAPDILSRAESPAGHWDTALGNWFTDAIRWATETDIALQNNGGIRRDLEAGPVAITDIFEMNFRDELYIFEATGTELLEILEHDLRDGNERPMQVSGLRFTFDRTRPQGQRVIDSDIDPARVYTVSAEDYLCQRGERFFGRTIPFTESGIQIVDAQIRYAREHQKGKIEAQSEGRIREVNAVE